jgi:chitin synthase
MHVIGLALLIFVVLPEIDVVKGAMLTNCVAFIPAVFGKLFCFSKKKKKKKNMTAISKVLYCRQVIRCCITS